MSINSFPAIADPSAKIIVLGSMPGEASLLAQQYYAHPRNHFWPIMGELFGALPSLPYDKRVAMLKKNKVAVWDVLKSCERQGSLDSAISCEEANDFNQFFHAHRKITHVFFNGSKAEQSFKKLVIPNLKVEIITKRLPSTSPAHAGSSLAKKLIVWREIIDAL